MIICGSRYSADGGAAIKSELCETEYPSGHVPGIIIVKYRSHEISIPRFAGVEKNFSLRLGIIYFDRSIRRLTPLYYSLGIASAVRRVRARRRVYENRVNEKL